MNIHKFLYQIRNWRAHLRALLLGNSICVGGAMTLSSELFGVLIKADGTRIDLGKLGSRVVTTAGVNYMRDDFNAATGGADITNFKFHAMGVGGTAEAITDTVLAGEVETRTTGTQSGAVSKIYVTAGTIVATAPRVIVEHGIFSASSGATLWDRTVFAAVNLGTGDGIAFTYTLSLTDGG